MRFRLRGLFIGCGVTTVALFAYLFFLAYTQNQTITELKQTTLFFLFRIYGQEKRSRFRFGGI